VEALRQYLDNGGDANLKDRQTGDRLLCISAENGDLEAVGLLLDHGADPNLPSHAWPIHFAAGKGRLECVELLLRSGSEVHCLDEQGGTPLADAAAGGHLKVVELLLEQDADPAYRDKYGKRPIIYAAEKGHREIVELLAPYSLARENQIAELRLELAGNEFSEALSEAKRAAYLGEFEKIREYIESGGNPNGRGLGGGTLLQSAAINGRIEILSYLLAHGADPNLVDENGASALDLAVNAKTADAYQLLFPITAEKIRRRVERQVEKNRKNGFLKW
jgi:ankyrin repeat protein